MKFYSLLLKYFILFLSFYEGSSLLAQQTFVKGIVSIQNSLTETGKRIFVRNAQVVDNSGYAQPVISDDSGQFVLVYVGLPEGVTVHFNVKKPSSDLEVVNISSLNAVTGQKDLVRIAMAPVQQISEYRKRLYNIGVTSGERRLKKILMERTKQLAFLKKTKSTDSLKLYELTENIKMLEDKRYLIDSNAIDFARKYSEINLDDASPYLREAIIAFQKGNLDSALNILRRVNLENRVNKILSQRKDIKVMADAINRMDSLQKLRTEDLSSVLLLQARLFRANLQFDSAAKYFELRMRLDPENGRVVFDYAEALSNLDQDKKSLEYYFRALSLFQIDSTDSAKNIAKTYLNIGSGYQNLLDFDSAETYYKRAKQISLNFERKDSSITVYLVAAEVNLGTLYITLGEIKNAQEEIENSIKILREQQFREPETGRMLAVALETSANLNLQIQDTVEAEKNHIEAVKIMEGLIKNDSQENLHFLASIYNNLGALFSISNFLKSKEFLDSALILYEKLSKVDKARYEPHVANVYYSLSHIYFEKNNFEEGEKNLSFSENIIKKYEKIDSSYILISADHLKEIGSFYYIARNYKEAIKKFLQALLQYKKFPNNSLYERYNGKTIFSKIVDIEMELGRSYLLTENYIKSEKFYKKSLESVARVEITQSTLKIKMIAQITDGIAESYFNLGDLDSCELYTLKTLEILNENPHQETEFVISIVNAEFNLGKIYFLKKNYKKGEKYYLKAISLLEKYQKDHVLDYSLEIADVKIKLALLYEQDNNQPRAKEILEETLKIYQRLNLIKNDDFSEIISFINDKLTSLQNQDK